MKKLVQGRRMASTAAVAAFLVTFAANPVSAAASRATGLRANAPSDVATAVRALPRADVLQSGTDGTAQFLRGDLGHVGNLALADPATAERVVTAHLGPALSALRLTTGDVVVRHSHLDAVGNRHIRYDQKYQGLDVVGGDLVAHVDSKGTITGLNGLARSADAVSLGARDMGPSAAMDFLAADSRYQGMKLGKPRAVYVMTPEGRMYKAYESVVTGKRGQDPVKDNVFVDVDSGAIVAVHPQIQFAESRKIYSANNGTSLPGTLKLSEGGAATSDVDVNAAYNGTGATYEAYKSFWNRDSYNNAGAVLISSVHYSRNYCNAYWDGTQMVYGDGDGTSSCLPLARAQDVTGHELTHAVTENESGLVYSGEPGGMNEAMSDIFGAFTEAYVDGGKNGTLAVSADTWKIGEDILPPYLRLMSDPAADGASADFYSASVGNLDVHYSSGLGNLAFYLMSQGGKHPRNKSTLNVTGLGMAKAIRVMYEAQINVITSSAKYLAIGNATVTAATNLGLSAADKVSIADAWNAVGVPVPGGSGTGTPPPPTATTLSNGVAVTGLSGATSSQAFYKIVVPAGQTSLVFNLSGGTGDADMYTKLGSAPTTTTYDCRPYVSGNTETCTVNSPAAGTYYVMLNGYSAYSGVSLKATYAGSTGGGDPVLTSGVAVTGISGATGSAQYWQITPGAGKKLTVVISGGTGDADLYLQAGSRPTTTTYTCRPYITGNAETCTVTSAVAGPYYVMLRGYTAFTGVSLKATVQ